ncbi:hypothetical protein M153_3100027241 [Pseudoloma neurophilia]|uniref:YjeF N-terminal domain-containing protein n=1 Tax=Pseudoloma neurophilia TaxID=146866 RepID=A0A0R0M0T2_9MICR|nr:hypothetical protein M153_3100027241 [Pseudoloma neurophilia]
MVKTITNEEAKHIDWKISETGAQVKSLIEIAGYLAFDLISTHIIKEKSKILVAIGPGHNGSDGLVIARYLKMNGHDVTLIYEKIKHEDLLLYALNCKVEVGKEVEPKNYDFVIDAVFGFCGRMPLQSPYDKMVTSFQNHPNIISIDVPSSEDLHVENLVTFIAPKSVKNCKNVYLTRSFFPRHVYDDENDYLNHKKLI